MENQATKMILDQINLLKSEESKLRKFIEYNKDSENIVEVHLQEIEKKKERLYRLCSIMGINAFQKDSQNNAEDDSLHHQKQSQPTGRFGSALINWHSSKSDY